MTQYRGIEGLRGWLAWIVVLSHIGITAGARLATARIERIEATGDDSVRVFIIISGFVITHLLLTKRETYADYIARRFLRLFPVYVLALACSAVLSVTTMPSVLASGWVSPSLVIRLASEQREILAGHAPLHLVAHLAMLHGAIPGNLLANSQYMFIPPAWSLSLEWQYYLIAPFLTAALANRRWRWPMLVLLLAMALAYRHRLFGQFALPSFFPGAVSYFLAGIGSRIMIERLPETASYPVLLLGAALALRLVLGQGFTPFAIWITLLGLIRTRAEGRDAASRALGLALDSPLARAAGARSYSVYLMHWPILVSAIALCHRLGPASPWPAFMLTGAVTIAATAAVSQLTWQFIEQPCIRLGGRFTRWRAQRAAA